MNSFVTCSDQRGLLQHGGFNFETFAGTSALTTKSKFRWAFKLLRYSYLIRNGRTRNRSIISPTCFHEKLILATLATTLTVIHFLRITYGDHWLQVSPFKLSHWGLACSGWRGISHFLARAGQSVIPPPPTGEILLWSDWLVFTRRKCSTTQLLLLLLLWFCQTAGGPESKPHAGRKKKTKRRTQQRRRHISG